MRALCEELLCFMMAMVSEALIICVCREADHMTSIMWKWEKSHFMWQLRRNIIHQFCWTSAYSTRPMMRGLRWTSGERQREIHVIGNRAGHGLCDKSFFHWAVNANLSVYVRSEEQWEVSDPLQQPNTHANTTHDHTWDLSFIIWTEIIQISSS